MGFWSIVFAANDAMRAMIVSQNVKVVGRGTAKQTGFKACSTSFTLYIVFTFDTSYTGYKISVIDDAKRNSDKQIRTL